MSPRRTLRWWTSFGTTFGAPTWPIPPATNRTDRLRSSAFGRRFKLLGWTQPGWRPPTFGCTPSLGCCCRASIGWWLPVDGSSVGRPTWRRFCLWCIRFTRRRFRALWDGRSCWPRFGSWWPSSCTAGWSEVRGFGHSKTWGSDFLEKWL